SDASFDVLEAVRKSVRQLLFGRRPGLANVVAGDGDRVVLRRMRRTPLEHVDDEAERWLGRVDPGVLRLVLLQNVVLDGSANFFDRSTLLLGGDDVERGEDGRGAIERHRDGDLVEGDPREERLHVREGRDGDAALPYLANGAWVV